MTSTTQHCVVREIAAGDHQFVPVSEVPFLNVGETLFAGQFNSQTESHGPSGSHKRTVCLPVRRNDLVEVVVSECVLRNLGDGSGEQYVPRSEAGVLRTGERTFVGAFRGQTEKHGPYGSHARTVCSPVSRVFSSTIN